MFNVTIVTTKQLSGIFDLCVVAIENEATTA